MNGHCIVWEMKTNILSAKFLKSLNNYITFLCYFTNMPSSLTWLPLAKANPPPSNKTTPHGTIFSAAFHWRSGGRGLPFSERRNNIIALYFAFEIKCRRFWNSYYYHNVPNVIIYLTYLLCYLTSIDPFRIQC